jgi:ribosomal protein S18 acetylase RimI-like enzyme
MPTVQANSLDQIQEARTLFREYETGLGISLCFQNFEQELANLPGDYQTPDGRLLLCEHDGLVAGCIALRKLEPGVCEMKRLYVRPAFRGKGLGKFLVKTIIHEAREIGYERMRLDTLPGRMDDAIALYRSMGFKEIEPYYQNPAPETLYMELDLQS